MAGAARRIADLKLAGNVLRMMGQTIFGRLGVCCSCECKKRCKKEKSAARHGRTSGKVKWGKRSCASQTAESYHDSAFGCPATGFIGIPHQNRLGQSHFSQRTCLS